MSKVNLNYVFALAILLSIMCCSPRTHENHLMVQTSEVKKKSVLDTILREINLSRSGKSRYVYRCDDPSRGIYSGVIGIEKGIVDVFKINDDANAPKETISYFYEVGYLCEDAVLILEYSSNSRFDYLKFGYDHNDELVFSHHERSEIFKCQETGELLTQKPVIIDLLKSEGEKIKFFCNTSFASLQLPSRV